MSIDVVRQVLVNDPATFALVGDRIGPKDAFIDQPVPYIVIAVESSEPYNTLQGFAGLSRSEIEVTAWSDTYAQADAIATAARAAMEAAGNFTIKEPSDLSAFQQDVTIYGHAYVFQVFG